MSTTSIRAQAMLERQTAMAQKLGVESMGTLIKAFESRQGLLEHSEEGGGE